MPIAATGAAPDFDRHFRRAVWVAWALFLLGAGCVYCSEKAANDRGAFNRWRHQVLEFWDGKNIWEPYFFPNPPIFPLAVLPLMLLPPVVGAAAWFALKGGLATVSAVACARMAREPTERTCPIPSWVWAATLLLSLRPILGDLHHANNNLVILGLIVATLAAWQSGRDILAGLALALAISFKVTPALFVPYFLYKRSWRTVGATLVGVGLFLFVVPTLILGPSFNAACLGSWWKRILSPYVVAQVVSKQEVNQSMVGTLTRLLTAPKLVDASVGGNSIPVNVVALTDRTATLLIKGLSIGLVGLLACFCRPKSSASRDDPRLLAEFSLVVLTMLFVSERSWKHHYVTVLLPYTYLVHVTFRPTTSRRVRDILAACLVLSAALMATTSSEVGGLFLKGQGHKVAQAYGMFFWSGLVLYGATAWRLMAERRPPANVEAPTSEIPAPHLARVGRKSPVA